MVLLAGPRQAGKTWLAQEVAKRYSNAVYLNYDDLEQRQIMRDRAWPLNTDLLILDELHKMPQWKNFLKGLYDTKPAHLHLLVTGSARLEVYQQAGDSLAGRYFLHHLFPFSAAELKSTQQPADLDRLIVRSGFPEPYLAENDTEAARWRMQYITSLVHTDVLEFENIQNLKNLQTVFELLRTKVGSPVSYKSIAEDVAISPTTVKKYIQILEALYVVFSVRPYSKNIARSLLKEPKIYFFDSGLVKGDKGVCFENLVATSLLKTVYAYRDYRAEPYQLNYIRTKDGQEIDFALVCDEQVTQLIEVKYADSSIAPFLKNFAARYQFPAIQLVKELRNPQSCDGVELLRAADYK